MKSRAMKGWLASALLCLSLPSLAEDIDLFVGVPPDAADDLPNVLFVIDNTANWGNGNDPQPFNSLKLALSTTFSNLDVDSYRVGIMFFSESEEEGEKGGYVRAAIRTMNEDNKKIYSKIISELDPNGDKGNGAIGSLVMAEAWRYYSAGFENAPGPFAGNMKAKADFNGNVGQHISASSPAGSGSLAAWQLSGNALSSYDATSYNSPLAENSCARNFIIYISNGTSNDNNSVITQSEALLKQANLGVLPPTIRLSDAKLQGNPIDEWARFMSDSVLGITTYTININPDTNVTGRAWTAVLRSMAEQSSGKPFVVNGDESDVQGLADAIAAAVNTALSEIQSVNSVYASVSLPVSVNTQGTYLNQVFVGMFRPAQGALPRWDGNLKQYRLGYPDGSEQLATLDADGVSAINSGTGFVAECARSYWTPTVADNYWTSILKPSCLALPEGVTAASNTPDGNMVEKGGQGYMTRAANPANRTVYVQAPTMTADSSNLLALSTTSVSADAVGADDATEHGLLINWLKGYNNRPSTNDDPDPDGFITDPSAMRPSVHADVVHSRPVAINFGTDSAPEVSVFYGANDGLLRAVNGNRGDNPVDANAGKEQWAFLPQEFYPHIKRLRDNTQQIYYPGLPIEEARNRKNYGFDGPIVAYQADSNPATPEIDTAWIYASMRRGGRSIYAFDVSTPSAPQLKWRAGCLGDSCVDGLGDEGMTDLGQTWAAPSIVTAEGYDGGDTPLLLVSGGYDACEDSFPYSCDEADGFKGNALYVLDAFTGDQVKAFTTVRGIAADITPVKSSNGMLMYAYTADMGGNIYRLSGPAGAEISDTPPAQWVLTQIASLGCDTATSTCDNKNRKFLYAPDVVFENSTYYLLLGSGDREKPLGDASDVSNYFFMVQDRPTDTSWLTSEATRCGGANMLCVDSLTTIDSEADPTTTALQGKKGWRLYMRSGEQVVTSAITVFGVTTFSTNQPEALAPGQCTNNLGIARVYNVEYENASGVGEESRSKEIEGGGLPPSPVAGMVVLDDGTTVPFIIGSDADSPLAGREPKTTGTTSIPKTRIYWNLEE